MNLVNIRLTLSDYYKKNESVFIVIAFITAIISCWSRLHVMNETTSLLADIVKIFFNFIILNAVILSVTRNFDWKYNHLFKEELVFSLIINNFVFMLFPITQINIILNHLIFLVIPFDIVKAILDDQTAIFWA